MSSGGREILRNLDEGVDLDDAALDPALKPKKKNASHRSHVGGNIGTD